MNDPSLVRFLRRHLDSSLFSLTSEQASRLRKARSLALGRQKQAWHLPFLATQGGLSLPHFDFFMQRALGRLAALLLISGLIAFWHAQTYIIEIEELDSAILTDEMPIDIITNKGFNEWLHVSAQR